MAKQLRIFENDLQENDFERLHAKGFTIGKKNDGKYEVMLPEGWEVQHRGCLFYLITDCKGETVITYMRGNGLFFRA